MSDVVLVQWPGEPGRRAELVAGMLPRLLLVEPGSLPPDNDDCLEDWVCLPADDLEVRLRVATLASKASRHGRAPSLDDDGLLHAARGWVHLSPVEARLTAALLDRFGAVVSRDCMSRSGWPGGAPGRNALDVHVLRLRRRLRPVGLGIRTVRSRGYLMEMDAPTEPGSSPQPPDS